MAVTDGVLWVTNSDDRTVSRLGLADGRRLGAPTAVGPAPIAAVVDGEHVWVLDQDGPSLTRLATSDGRVVGEAIDLPMRPRGLAITPSGVWVVGVDPASAVLVRPAR